MRNWFKKQNDEMIELQVDDTERRIIVRALADLRDKQRMAHKNYDFLDMVLLKDEIKLFEIIFKWIYLSILII